MMPPPATKELAAKLGFIRPRSGGEGRKLSRLYHAGEWEAVAVDEGARTQWWYRPIQFNEPEGTSQSDDKA